MGEVGLVVPSARRRSQPRFTHSRNVRWTLFFMLTSCLRVRIDYRWWDRKAVGRPTKDEGGRSTLVDGESGWTLIKCGEEKGKTHPIRSTQMKGV